MSKLPDPLINSLEKAAGFDRKAFIAAHESEEQVVSIRYNPQKQVTQKHERVDTKVPWCSTGYYLKSRPVFTFDPYLHAGAYYVQEASSMFLEQALLQVADLSADIKVLDLCAAPGGKSTLIQSLISPQSLLVSNEVIRARVNTLEENLVKWGAPNVVITNNDARDFAALGQSFDTIVVDAPCSGSGLFRKDPDAINEWSEQNVLHCAQRQQRILSDIVPCLNPGGILVYSTCSFSEEEDEEIADWLVEDFGLESAPIMLDRSWGVVESYSARQKAAGYRFYPDKLRGEGFYIACFRNISSEKISGQGRKMRNRTSKLEKASATESALANRYIEGSDEFDIVRLGDRLLAFPRLHKEFLVELMDALYIRKAGFSLGKTAGKELIPDHALALSQRVNKNLPAHALNLDDALRFLRREELKVDGAPMGWTLASYQGLNLGWMKVLANRINNYYPTEWRILKK